MVRPASGARSSASPGAGSQRGFSILELAVAIVIVLVFAGVLLSRLRLYQEAAEQARMEYQVNTLKLALQLRIGDELARQRAVDYATVAGENPVSWLEAPMPGYRGEAGPDEARLLSRGSWYFDRELRELVYLPLRDEHLAADSTGRKRIRLQARPLRAEAGAAAVVGVRFGPVESYRWMLR